MAVCLHARPGFYIISIITPHQELMSTFVRVQALGDSMTALTSHTQTLRDIEPALSGLFYAYLYI